VLPEDLIKLNMLYTHTTDKDQLCPAPHPDYFCFSEFEKCVGLDPARNFQPICVVKCKAGTKFYVSPDNGVQTCLSKSIRALNVSARTSTMTASDLMAKGTQPSAPTRDLTMHSNTLQSIIYFNFYNRA
jgi:hypothetical protein